MTEYSINIFDGVFENIKADYQAHDKTCSSIPHMWLGHKGGVSDMWSQGPCDGCNVWFYIEGLTWVEDNEIDDLYYCDCCNRKR